MPDDNRVSTVNRAAQPGTIVTFGHYPQTAAGSDRTPIRWRVLENSGGELFLLSEYLLDCRRYHGDYTAITWRDCDLRAWLHETFYPAAFDAAEQARILPTHNTDHGADSPATDDRVFLLSVAEVERLTASLGKEFRRARGTEFAKTPKADGCLLYVMDKNVPADYLHEDGQTYGCSWWWLRDQGRVKDQGSDPARAVFVGTRASIRHYAHVDLTGYGVRPAVKLNLSS